MAMGKPPLGKNLRRQKSPSDRYTSCQQAGNRVCLLYTSYRDPNFGFEELPADWTCPVCKMPKKAFVRKK